MAEPEPTPPVGAVTLTKLRAKTPDSIRVHPYNPKAHGASKYEMEPETRPPVSNTSFLFIFTNFKSGRCAKNFMQTQQCYIFSRALCSTNHRSRTNWQPFQTHAIKLRKSTVNESPLSLSTRSIDNELRKLNKKNYGQRKQVIMGLIQWSITVCSGHYL